MGVLKGYFDDSGTEDDPQHHACTVAGYVGTVEAWSTLEHRWNEVLVRHGVPYFHMKEFAHFRPPFDKWKHDEAGRISFLKDLITVIGESKFYGVGTTIRLADLQRFNRERHHDVGAYALAVYGCVLELNHHYPPDRTVELVLVFDHCHKVLKKLATVEEYAMTDMYYSNCLNRIAMSALPKTLSFQDVPGIQVADFVAWEARKSSEEKNEWFETRKHGDDPNDWFFSLAAWSLEAHGRFPAEKRSCSELLNVAPIEGVVLDYRALCIADDARGHTWP